MKIKRINQAKVRSYNYSFYIIIITVCWLFIISSCRLFADQKDTNLIPAKKITMQYKDIFYGFILSQTDSILVLKLAEGDTASLFMADIIRISDTQIRLSDFAKSKYNIDRYSVIEAKSGEIHRGYLRLLEKDKVYLETEKYKIKVIQSENIASIKSILDNYFTIGLSFASPVGVNFLVSDENDLFVVRMSGGYIPNNAYGVQFNAGIKLYENYFTAFHLTLGSLFKEKITEKVNGGYTFLNHESTSGFGLFFDSSINSFFCELGLSYFGMDKIVTPTVQIGLVYQFKWENIKPG